MRPAFLQRIHVRRAMDPQRVAALVQRCQSALLHRSEFFARMVNLREKA